MVCVQRVRVDDGDSVASSVAKSAAKSCGSGASTRDSISLRTAAKAKTAKEIDTRYAYICG